MDGGNNAWIYWALGSAVFASLTAIFAKLGLKDVDPDLATWFRTLFILGVLAAILTIRDKWADPRAWPASSWIFLTLSGLATGASWVCYFRALQGGDASLVAPIDKMSVILVAFFAIAFLGERPGPREILGIALVGVGLGLIAWK